MNHESRSVRSNPVFHVFLWDIVNLWFGHFGHAWLHTPKLILSKIDSILLHQMTVDHQVRQLTASPVSSSDT